MKFIKYIFLMILVNYSFISYSQIDSSNIDFSNIDYTKVDISKYDLSKIDPAKIPDASFFRSKGVPEDQINKIMDYKKSRQNTSTVITNQEIPKNNKDNNTEIGDKYESSNITTDAPVKVDVPAKIFGQELFRNNNIKFYEKASEIVAPDNYILGADDELNIVVWGYSDYSKVFKINEKGFIAPDNIGRIYLKGLTFGNAKLLLTNKFGSILDLQNSQIDITLSYSRVININIIGEVFKPGSYKIPAINTAFNALVAVGGPTDIGSIRNIYIKRNGKIIDSLDVYKFLMQPDYNPEIYLEDNDYIFVPVAKKTVKISGEIKRPNIYELKPDENLNDAFYFAGGITAGAYKQNIQIKRFHNNHSILIDVNLDSLLKNKKDFILFDEDEIIISKIPAENFNVVTAEGRVKIPGTYELKPGQKVSDLLEKTEGVLFDAYTKTAYLSRLNKNDFTRSIIIVNLENILQDKNSIDNLPLKKFDVLKVLSKYDFSDTFNIHVLGQVRKPGEIEYHKKMNLIDVLFLAGGLKPEAVNNRIEISRIVNYDTINKELIPIRTTIKTFQINPDLSLNEEAKSFLMQPYDQVFIRVHPDFWGNRNVVINGEVKYPGVYSLLSKDEDVASLIKRAGDTTQFAFLEGTTMRRGKDNIGLVYLNLGKALKRPGSKFNIIMEEGDTITIPTINELIHLSGAIGNKKYNDINAPFFSNKRARFYIKKFGGGFDHKCKRNLTYVIYANGIMKGTKDYGFINIFPKVKKGSSIYLVYKEEKIKNVNDKKPFDWNKFIENSTLKLTGILTLWLLITKM